MHSRGVAYGSQLAFADQAHIAEQSGRTMRELIQKVMPPLFDLGPVLHPALHLEDVLAQPAPQLLKGIEPGGIGRQPHGGDPWVTLQSRQHVRVRMNVPVILDHM
jgi:hypothetical protein